MIWVPQRLLWAGWLSYGATFDAGHWCLVASCLACRREGYQDPWGVFVHADGWRLCDGRD